MTEEKDAKLGELLEAVSELEKRDRNLLRAFLTVLSNNQNNGVTPIENCICEMVDRYHEWHEIVTSGGTSKWRFGIEWLQREIDEAKTWLDDAVTSARHIARVYPHLLVEESVEEGN